MTDTLDHLSLDNYADLLACADMVRATAQCTACSPGARPVRTDALWVLHDRLEVLDLLGDPDGTMLGEPRFLCARHASEWVRRGSHPGFTWSRSV